MAANTLPCALNMHSRQLFVVCVLLLTTCFHQVAQSQIEDEIPKIGIIGGGIGGTSAAYFLKEAFGDKVEVDVFETQKVGGRLALISIDGQEYEAGGAVIHPKNEYMVNFTRLFGLSGKEGSDGILGLYNNKEGLYFQTSRWKAVTVAKLFWRYGWDIKRIEDLVAEMLVSFRKIYDYQEKGMAFTTVEDLIRAMDERFVNYTQFSARTILKDAGFSDIFIDELVAGALRDNYGQTLDVHGFVGFVNMAGVEPGLWAVEGGNKKVAEKLLEASGAKLIHGTVTHVFQAKSEGGTVSYEVQYEKGDVQSGKDKTGNREYDLLIIATPLKAGSRLKINFEDFSGKLHLPDTPYHSLDALFVHGKPNGSYFGFENMDDFPKTIMTSDPEVFFNTLSEIDPVMKKDDREGKPNEYSVQKSFLNKVPSQEQINSLFDIQKDVRLVNWLAYPEYTPNMELPSFVLHDRLYYINAIETAASAMEMSVVGAKNVALLAFNQWFNHFDKIDEVSFPPISGGGEGRQSDEL